MTCLHVLERSMTACRLRLFLFHFASVKPGVRIHASLSLETGKPQRRLVDMPPGQVKLAPAVIFLFLPRKSITLSNEQGAGANVSAACALEASPTGSTRKCFRRETRLDKTSQLDRTRDSSVSRDTSQNVPLRDLGAFPKGRSPDRGLTRSIFHYLTVRRLT